MLLAAAAAVAVSFAWAAVRNRIRGYSDTHGIEVVRYELDSALLGRSLPEIALVPPGDGRRSLLVLLHGRGTEPKGMLTDALFAALAALADRAPVVVLLNGGDHSYYHDRRDGRWGSMMLREAIPDARRRFATAPGRVAIGGVSMGGFGALYLASKSPQGFCAVGGHSAALWRSGGETPQGAFDDAEDYARTDVWRAARAGRYASLPVWLDVGDADGFRPADMGFAQLLRSRGVRVNAHVWPGSHSHRYWDAHTPAYLRFYITALERCTQP